MGDLDEFDLLDDLDELLLGFEGCLITDDPPQDPPKTSLNWANHSKSIDLTTVQVHAVTSPVAHPIAAHVDEFPFILDSGATCHISPERSDFKTLNPIPPEDVGGIGDTRVNAIGEGTIELSVIPGRRLYLHNVKFVPAAALRVISVVALNRDSKYHSHFDSDSCWIGDQSGAIVARGTVSQLSSTRNLYTLDTLTPQVTHHRTEETLRSNIRGAVTHPTGSALCKAPHAYPKDAAPAVLTCRYLNCHHHVDRDEITQEFTEYCSLAHMRDDVRRGVPLCPVCNQSPRRMDGNYCGSSCEWWDEQQQQQPLRLKQYSPPSEERPHSVSPPSYEWWDAQQHQQPLRHQQYSPSPEVRPRSVPPPSYERWDAPLRHQQYSPPPEVRPHSVPPPSCEWWDAQQQQPLRHQQYSPPSEVRQHSVSPPSYEWWDAQQQQQPLRYQQYFPPSEVRPRSVPPPGNVTWGTPTGESLPTGNNEANNRYLSLRPPEGLVLCPKCGSEYLASGRSWHWYETGREDSVGYMSLPPCPICGYSE